MPQNNKVPGVYVSPLNYTIRITYSIYFRSGIPNTRLYLIIYYKHFNSNIYNDKNNNNVSSRNLFRLVLSQNILIFLMRCKSKNTFQRRVPIQIVWRSLERLFNAPSFILVKHSSGYISSVCGVLNSDFGSSPNPRIHVGGFCVPSTNRNGFWPLESRIIPEKRD